MRRLAGAALLVLVAAACRPDTVAVRFRPRVGTTYRYEVDVTAETTTRLEGTAPETKREHVHLIEEQTVEAPSTEGTVVRVLVGHPGGVAQEFTVRYDTTGELVGIDAAAGTAADIVGAIGVPEIAPGGAGGPGRRVGPGDRWTRTRRVRVPGAAGVVVARSDGHLVELGIAGKRKVARIGSTTVLPLRVSAPSVKGTATLDGSERIVQRVAYDLVDGTVHDATATTTGSFTVRVEPPFGVTAPAVPGTLEVRVRSTTRRVQ